MSMEIDTLSEGDTAALRESLAHLSNASRLIYIGYLSVYLSSNVKLFL